MGTHHFVFALRYWLLPLMKLLLFFTTWKVFVVKFYKSMSPVKSVVLKVCKFFLWHWRAFSYDFFFLMVIKVLFLWSSIIVFDTLKALFLGKFSKYFLSCWLKPEIISWLFFLSIIVVHFLFIWIFVYLVFFPYVTNTFIVGYIVSISNLQSFTFLKLYCEFLHLFNDLFVCFLCCNWWWWSSLSLNLLCKLPNRKQKT